MRGAALFLAFTALLAGGLHAVDPNRAVSQYIRDGWGTDRGFPGGGVYAFAQTPDDYLWVGTDRGLVRFDGVSFHLISDFKPASPALPPVLGLATSPLGRLWVRLRGSTLPYYANGVFEDALWPQLREVAVTALSVGRDGHVLVGGVANGVVRFVNGQFTTVAPPGALPHSPVTSLAETADGAVWLGTLDAGLFYFRDRAVHAVKAGLPDAGVTALLATGPQEVWVGTAHGLVRWTGASLTAEGIPPPLRKASILAMLTDRQSNRWVGTAGGLFRINANGAADGVAPLNSKAAVTALFEDREGNLWVGMSGKIERLRDGAFKSYGRAEGLPSEQNGPILAAGERVWFGPAQGGLFRLGDTSPQLAHDVVYSIAKASDGLWIGRQNGLTHLRLTHLGEGVAAQTYTHKDGLAEDSVFAVHENRGGTVWAGTLNRGVSRWKDGKFTNYNIGDGLASNDVAAILETADGTTWFATPNGLSALSGSVWRTYRTSEGLPSDGVNCLLEDSMKTLWMGTANGLAFVRAQQIGVPREVPESLHDRILGIAEDRLGWLWVTTPSRVMRIRREPLLQGKLTDLDVREYGATDGLYSSGGVHRSRSVVTGDDGRIWLSLERGISVVNPTSLTAQAVPAVVRIQGFSADGNVLPMQGLLQVPSATQRIRFDYGAVSLSDPERLKYRYWLEGYDHTWSGPVTVRDVAYTNLAPKTYRFHVMASDANGLWSGPEAAMALEVQPAFWQTAWFQMAAGLTGVLAILLTVRLRVRQLGEELNVRFEERLGERTRIAQELHDTLLQGILSMSMRLHLFADSLSDDAQKAQLEQILQSMGRVIDEGRKAVHGLRTMEADPVDLETSLARVRQEAHVELPGQPAAAFRVVVEGQARRLHPVIRDEVYRIGREALVNAFRHARATSIELEIDYGRGGLRVVVRDNGCGIDPRVLKAGRDGHWGLSGMRERTERVGAELKMWSRAGAGTEIALSVPSHIAFQEPPSPAWWRRKKRRARRKADERENADPRPQRR